MNTDDRALLIGMIYGDGTLNVRKRTRKNGDTYISSEMQITHSPKQREYLLYKSELLRDMFGGKHSVRQYKVFLPKTGKQYVQHKLSKSNKYFVTLKKLLYDNGTKRFTSRALSMLTPHGIAIWYMDDGSPRININKQGNVSSVATDIATNCSLDEVNTIIDYFSNEHGIEFKKRRDKKCATESQYSIQANTNETKKFCKLIDKHIIPSMQYKLKHVASLYSQERMAPKGACRACNNTIYDNRRKGLCVACYTRQIRQR